jgi:Ulp1 family protease
MQASKKKRSSNDDSLRKMSRTAKASNTVMVVFPFGSGDIDTDSAAKGLKELGCASVVDSVPKTSDVKEGTRPTSTDEHDKADWNKKSNSRNHFLTIGEDENKRLLPGGWLNDTLVDFWMQW